MSGNPNYLKAGDINRSTRSHKIVDYLLHEMYTELTVMLLTPAQTVLIALETIMK